MGLQIWKPACDEGADHRDGQGANSGILVLVRFWGLGFRV